MKKKNLKRRGTKTAFLNSLLSLILCVIMLIGATLAWFTDTATNGSNKIKAGNLDIDLIMDKEENGNYVSIAGEPAAIFGANDSLYAQNKSSDTLWEPGKTQIVYLGVQNKGTLALKYSITLKVKGDLAPALEYAVIDGAKAANLASAASWTDIKTASGAQTGDVSEGTLVVAKNGMLADIASGTPNETDYFALAVHMKEDAGNTYKGEAITIDVTVNAGQKNAEADAFDNEYDKDYGIICTLDGCTADENNPTTIKVGETVTLKFTSQPNYAGEYNTFSEDDFDVSNTTESYFSFNNNITPPTATVVISNPKGDVTIEINNAKCFAAGTKITMADNSVKNIEDIAEGDTVLTFNHETGKYEGQKVYIAWKGDYKAKAFTLHFDNGSTVSIVGEHDLFEQESLRYVTVYKSTAEQLIGRHFYSAADGKYVMLTDVTYEMEAVDFYTIHTEYNKNCIANGMLSVPVETAGSLNIYKFSEDLSIDHAQLKADIAEFGLYEYPDDAAYSKELYDIIGVKYINIIVGKGFDTRENIFEEIDAFLAGEY